MKILMITDQGFEQGGVSTYILSIKKLLEIKHSVRILASNENSHKDRFDDYEYNGFNNTPSAIQLGYRLFNPFSAIKLNEVLKTYKPDIIHLHFIFGSTSPSILGRLKNIPTIMTVHCETLIRPNDVHYDPEKCKHPPDSYCTKCDGFFRYYYNKLKYKIYKRERSDIDLFLANSKFIETQLRKDGIMNVKTEYLGIRLLKYSKIYNKQNLLYIGRLSKQKGVEYLLTAMPEVIKHYPGVKLTILGKGQDKENLMLLCKKLNLYKHVRFVDFVPNNEIYKYYKSSTLIIVPSISHEAFGLIGPEAMSTGRPVIGTNVGGIPEWLENGKTGFLVDPGNSEQIAKRVIQLLSDRKLLDQMGKNARKKAEQFSIEKHVIEIETIYKELIEKYKTKEAF